MTNPLFRRTNPAKLPDAPKGTDRMFVDLDGNLKLLNEDGVSRFAGAVSGGGNLPLTALRRAMDRAKTDNPITQPVYSGSVTVTQAAAIDAGTTKYYDVNVVPLSFRLEGGTFPGGAADAGSSPYAYQDLSGVGGIAWSGSFMTDSPTLTIKLRRQQATKFRIAINRRYTNKTASTYSTADGTWNYIVLANLSKDDLVTIETDCLITFGFPVFHGVYVQPTYNVWAPPNDLQVLVIGDSWTRGSNAAFSHDGFAKVLGQLIGATNTHCLGYSGTGYVAALNGTSFTGSTVAGSAVVSVSSTSGLTTGRPIMGSGAGALSAGIPRHAYITAIGSGQLTLNTPATADSSSVAMFSPTPSLAPLDFWAPGQRRIEWDFTKVPFTPDVFVIALGLNDDGNAAGLQAEMQGLYGICRAKNPTAPIFVVGIGSVPSSGGLVLTGGKYLDSYAAQKEGVIAAAVAAMGDANLYFIPSRNAASGSWFDGNGKVGTTTGNGNTDRLISSDGTHPNEAGHAYDAERIAQAMAATIR